MKLFNRKTKDSPVEERSLEAYDNEIKEKSEEVESLYRQIDQVREDTKNANETHKQNLKKIEEDYQGFIEEAKNAREVLEVETKKLQEKEEKFKAAYEEKQKELAQKVRELKKKKKDLLQRQDEMNETSFKRSRTRLENQLKELQELKKEQTDKYHADLEKLNTEFEKIKSAENEKIASLNQQKEAMTENSKKKVDELVKEKVAVQNDFEDSLEELTKAHQEELAQAKEEEDRLLEEKRMELKALNNEVESLRVLFNSTVNEFDTNKQRNEHEYNSLMTRYENDKQQALKENELVKISLDKRQRQLEADIARQNEEYQLKLDELNDYAEKLNEEITSAVSPVDGKVKELDQKYSEFVDYADKQYVREQLARDNDLSTLQYRLAQEEEQLKNRYEYLSQRFKLNEEDYHKKAESLRLQTSQIEGELREIEKKYHESVTNLTHEIDVLKNDKRVEFENRKSELLNELSEAKKTYGVKNNEINIAIRQTREQIEKVKESIKEIRQKQGEYELDFEDRKALLSKQHTEALQQIADKKVILENNIENLKALSEKTREDHEKNLAELAQKKLSVKQEHDENLTALQADNQKKLDALLAEYEQRVSALNQDNEEKLSLLAKQKEEKAKELVDNAVKRKETFEKQCQDLEASVDELTAEKEKQLIVLQTKKDELLNSLSTVRQHFSEEVENFSKEKKNIEMNQQEELLRLNTEHQSSVAKIQEEYEKLPQQELDAIRLNYLQTKSDYEKVLEELEKKKNEIDEAQDRLADANSAKQAEAEKVLVVRQKQIDELSVAQVQLETKLQEELDQKNNDISSYQQELNEKVDSIVASMNEEVRQYGQSLDDKFAARQKEYTQKQDSVKRQYDEELKAKQEELDREQTSFDGLIAEINAKKAKMESMYANKFTSMASETSNIQLQLDTLMKESEIERGELNRKLTNIRSEYANEVEKLKRSYEQSEEENIRTHDKYLSDIREKCASLKDEIVKIEEEERSRVANFELYESQKRSEMEGMSQEIDVYLAGVNEKLSSLDEQEKQLQEVHEQRITLLKEEIAKAMTRFDDLLKLKPQDLANAAYGKDVYLEEKTKEFRNKITLLEDSHKEMIDSINKKKISMIAEIKNELNSLIDGKAEKLREYNDEALEISLAYENMIREEKNKQERLKYETSRLESETKALREEIKAEASDILSALNKEKTLIEQEHAVNERQIADNYVSTETMISAQISKMETRKAALLQTLNNLQKKYDRIDEQINVSRASLKEEYSFQLDDMIRRYEVSYRRQKEKLKTIDVMKDESEDLFK